MMLPSTWSPTAVVPTSAGTVAEAASSATVQEDEERSDPERPPAPVDVAFALCRHSQPSIDSRAWSRSRTCRSARSRRRSSAAIRSPAGWSTATGWASRLPPRVRAGSLARPRAVPRAGPGRCHAGSPSRTWSRPASTSSPMARSAARATPTTSRPRSTGSISSTRRRARSHAAARTRAARRRADPPPRPVELRDVDFLRAPPTGASRSRCPGPFTMTQQAQDDYYGDERDAGAGVRRGRQRGAPRSRRAGADVVQIDEPYLQARPEEARAVRHRGRSTGRSTGSSATTVLHTCFGYAHVVADQPGGYPFLAELPTARRPDLSSRRPSRARSGCARRARRQDDRARRARPRQPNEVETPGSSLDRIRAALACDPARAARARARLRDEVPAARASRCASSRRWSRALDASVRRASDADRQAGRPVTRISEAHPDRVEVRGRDLTGDLMGRLSFTEYFHLLLTGRSRPTTSASSSTCCSSRSPSTG